MSSWVDFKALRAKLDFEQVLLYYGVEVKRKGDQHHGFCPLPGHQGKRNSPSFSANLKRGIFQCFGCGAKGNAIEFAAMMAGVDPNDGVAFRGIASELQRHFGLDAVKTSPAKTHACTRPEQKAQNAGSSPAVVNAPLDFQLQGLDAAHPYLISRGLTPDTIAFFALGFCSRGLLKNRVAIPLHDHRGRLIGYAGRVVDDTQISEANPRYRFPSSRKRDGKVFEFRKTRLVYNASRIKAPVDDLVVVEGFASVWWLHQHGLPNVVATMGVDCSERQSELIVSLVQPAGRVWVMPDGDPAGERLAETTVRLVCKQRFVRWLKLKSGEQPTDLPPEQLKSLFV